MMPSSLDQTWELQNGLLTRLSGIPIWNIHESKKDIFLLCFHKHYKSKKHQVSYTKY